MTYGRRLLLASHGEEDRDPIVTNYLDSFLPQKNERIQCCGTTRANFCPECLRLLAPTASDLPQCVREGSLKLPFKLHIILDDRRNSATGLQALALLGKEQASLRDINRDSFVTSGGPGSNGRSTYVLFPSPDSVPLSSVNEISTLVVLDCKWTRTKPTTSLVSDLPRVHLSSPPNQSHYWKSHTAEQGCLSTIEAIYYAATEVDPENADLIHLLWIFARQRASIQARGPWKDRIHLPYTEHGKEAMRVMRRQNKK
jgi:hypothetical protein